jgi:predicted AlkP superfamily phosphohydrolase/phosphomutase/tetratricopeptide (TPR) repeat protein
VNLSLVMPGLLSLGPLRPTKQRRTLLVGWDAADWKVLNPLLEDGKLPVFTELIERGVVADLITLEPVLSPLLWNSIATGKRADAHGILGFTEVDPASGRVRPVSSTSRRCKALWNILSQNGYRTNVVGWFGGHPAEPIRGVCVSDAFGRAFPRKGKAWPLAAGTVYPESLSETLAPLRIRPEEIDAETLRLFIPELARANAAKPNLVASLARILAECFTTHAAATWAMQNTEWDFMGVYYIGIDHFCHAFVNYHPPKPAWIEEESFELFQGVVNAGYRLMDLFLARLMQLAGPETTVMIVSDHGFHSDHLRPSAIPDLPTGPATQHRPLGILAMAGEGIRHDERIYSASLLDVTPTVLALFGLPAAEDMPGRVLSEAFETAPALGRIPSWETMEGEDGRHPAGFNLPVEHADELLEQFVALGYIDPQPPGLEQAAASCRRERQWNLARVFTSTWRFAEALPLLEELRAETPERPDFALALADCQLRLGLRDEAQSTAESALSETRTSAVGEYVLGKIAFEQRRFADSLAHFVEAERLHPGLADLYNRIGFAYLKLRRWSDAGRAFEKALEIDPHNAVAHQGQARVALRGRRFEEAAQAALTSIACRHDLPPSHFWLGMALLPLGQRERAIQAFETALSFQPPLRIAHRMLARLYGDSPQGRIHREAAVEFVRTQKARLQKLEGIRQEARHRAIDRAEARGGAPAETVALEFVLVSGLPRSGTSLMMQILAAGGLAVMTDAQRAADGDNPEGYYEWEAIKHVGAHPEILQAAAGKAIKVISMLLPALPQRHRYKTIFMDRPMEEVAASQWKMIENRRATPPIASREKMAEMLGDHRERILRGLRQAKNFSVLVVDYPALVRSPDEWLERIREFVGVSLDVEAMRNAIRPELHRNR